MQNNKIYLLNTRPVRHTLVGEAADHNIVFDEISFIQTEAIINDEIKRKIYKLSKENITVVFTSMTAVETVHKYLPANPSWKIYCIGNTTRKLVDNLFGTKSIWGTAKNAIELGEKIVKDNATKHVTFFCGDHRREELPGKLKGNNIKVDEIVIYKTIETPHIIKQHYDGILFYSPSAVKSFFLKNTLQNNTELFAIGSTTAKALKHFTQLPVIIAEMPGKENLVKLAIHHFSKSKIS